MYTGLPVYLCARCFLVHTNWYNDPAHHKENNMLPSVRPDYFEIVQRTAQHGLNEAASYAPSLSKAKWLAIWALDLTGEMNEADLAAIRFGRGSQEHLTEYGDVLWAIAAIQLLHDQTQEDFESRLGRVYLNARNIAKVGNLAVFTCETGEMCKKLARDGEDCWDSELIFDNLAVIYFWINELTHAKGGTNTCIGLMNSKLMARYPDGYSAKASKNRVV